MSKKSMKKCIWCSTEFESYPSAERKFCSLRCHYAHATKEKNPTGYTRHPHLSEYNRQMNKSRMTENVREKLRLIRLGSGDGKTYEKFYGRHLHRVVAEQKLGRKLFPGEVVHHIDGDHRNNSPENLLVLPNQRAHARLHKESETASHAKL